MIVGHGDRGEQLTTNDIRNIEGIDTCSDCAVFTHTLADKRNLQRDFILGIDQGNHFQCKDHIAILDVGTLTTTVEATIKAVGRNGNLLTAGDEAFLVIRCENGRTGNDVKVACLLQGLEIARQVLADFALHAQTSA